MQSLTSDSEDKEAKDKNRYDLFGECHIGFLKIIEDAIKHNEYTGSTIISGSVTNKTGGKGKNLKQR